MRFKDEEGQALILVALAMSIFLIGAIGLAVDGSNLYTQRQGAQAAADAAAQAGIMSIFDGTTGAGNTAGFTAGTAYTCTTTDQSTPCVYASKNGFGGSAIDTVAVSFPADSAFPGVAFSSDPVNLITVSVSRQVNTTLMRLLGPTVTTVSASATAAIVSVIAPTPIIVTHPSLPGSLNLNGTNDIKICGGPSRSVQVNSTDPAAYATGQGTVDLSHAGVKDSGQCDTGTGADFAVSGGPATNPGQVLLGSTGNYLSKISAIRDPLADVSAPTTAGLIAGTTTTINSPTDGCTSTCIEYTPGLWPQLIPGANTVIFKPGLYYVQGGGVNFKKTIGGGANNSAMCAGCTDPDTGNGMVIYDTVPAGTAAYPASRPTGGFTIDTLVNFVLQGANKTVTNPIGTNGCTTTANCTAPTGPYFGVLFWEDRTANAHTGNKMHQIGAGNGCFTLVGTIYITNTFDIMSTDSTHYQAVQYNGNPCSTTVQQGDIIVSTLTLKGTTNLQMNLAPYGFLNVRKVALIN
jgi:Flp pilus assembly protein TadG